MQINRCLAAWREPSEIILTGILDISLAPGYEVECYDCGLHTDSCESSNEAVAKWNELTEGENNGND